MQENHSLLSVGIDIGTTTTQVIFSHLKLTDVARPGQIPRMMITDREIVFQSDPFFTPLLDKDTIDSVKLKSMIDKVYEAARVSPGQIETGAVIITGETAKKKNADEILNSLAGFAGDFVVSVAGPHVESLIAGRGSGACQYSQSHFNTVLNIDIGGGSANIAAFRSGNFLSSAAMNFGGRILIIDKNSGKVLHIAEPAKIIVDEYNLKISIGQLPELTEIIKFCDVLSKLTIELIEGTVSDISKKLYLTEPISISGKNSVIMISGGIGYYYHHPVKINSISDMAIHDDIGPLLAQSLLNNPELNKYNIICPAETLRATVLGASTQTVTLSGSTIWAEKDILPLKNVPVVRPEISHENAFENLAADIVLSVKKWDLDAQNDIYAI
ncbi:MAG: ethanolamine ammonia-lyase reactivating factor EutA, partial [Chloroflexota bacterium]